MPEADKTPSVLDFQRTLEELRGVRGARVEIQGSDVTAIRVLVIPERETGQTIADVRTLAASILGTEVDPQRIEILRVAGPVQQASVRQRKLSGMSIERSQEWFHARVALELDGDVLVGESGSPSERGFEYRSVARATLQSLLELLEGPIDLDTVQILPMGDSQLAVVILGRNDETLVGTALVRLDEHDAIARATLDAVNRSVTASGASQRGVAIR